MELSEFTGRLYHAFLANDRSRRGMANLVSLVPLRKAMADVSRAEFDRHLWALRTARILRLKLAESHSGLTPEEVSACVWDGEEQLLNVSWDKPVTPIATPAAPKPQHDPLAVAMALLTVVRQKGWTEQAEAVFQSLRQQTGK